MKLGTARHGDGTRAFRQDDSGTIYYDVADVAALIAQPNWRSLTGEPGDAPAAEDLLLPILKPGKTLCIGLNYYDHAKEVGKEAPAFPTIFNKVQTSLLEPNGTVVLPDLSEQIDWEAELVIVIGKTVKHADEQSAREAILGYTVMNDLSIRDWQKRTSEWFQGKNFDASTPIGPVITTSDEIDPTQGLRVETLVNGVHKQDGNTAELIFDPVALVRYVTQFATLEVGDMIATGTPAGVGSGRKPVEWLKDGDVVVTRIEGIGELTNTIVIDR